MTGYIYIITNDINGKQYIGQTTNTIKKRFAEHIYDSKKEKEKERPLYRAMNKYGIEHFSVKQLEECDISLLNEREQYWIKKLHTYHYGYNATFGGEGVSIINYEQILNYYQQTHENCPDIAKKFNCHIDTVYSVLKKYNINILKNSQNNSIRLPILQLSLQNEVIQTFESCHDAARWLKTNQKTTDLQLEHISAHIGQVAKGKRRSAYGYRWQFLNEEDKFNSISKSKPVKCVTTNEIFANAQEAAKAYNLKTSRNIHRCCNNYAKTAGKHPITHEPLQWQYVTNEVYSL